MHGQKNIKLHRNRSLLACSNPTRHVYRYTMHKYNFVRVSAPFVAVVMAILIFQSFSRVWSKNFHFYDIRMMLAFQWQTESSETLLFARNFTQRKKKTWKGSRLPTGLLLHPSLTIKYTSMLLLVGLQPTLLPVNVTHINSI